MPNLTAAQITELKGYQTSGDRYRYWSALDRFGDPYAKLALGVVTNETYSGKIANEHLRVSAGEKGIVLDFDQSRKIGTELMEADFRLREGGLSTLSADAIMRYHTDVFKNYNLPPEAWTAYKILDDARRGGGEAKMNAVWNQMLSGDSAWINWATKGTLNQVGATFMGLGSNNSGVVPLDWTDAKFILKQGVATFVVLSIAESNRNINRIGGYSYNSVTGDWESTRPDPAIPGETLTFTAPPSVKQQLDAERAARIKHFGSNVLTSSIFEPNTSSFVAASQVADSLGLPNGVRVASLDNELITQDLRGVLAKELSAQDLQNATFETNADIATVYLSNGDQLIVTDGQRVQRVSGSFERGDNKVTVTEGRVQIGYEINQTLQGQTLTISQTPLGGADLTNGETTSQTYLIDPQTQALSPQPIAATLLRIDESGNNVETITRNDGTVLERTTHLLTGQVIEKKIESGASNLQTALHTTADFLSLVQAVQTGKPLPIVTSGLRLASTVSGNTTLAGASAAASAVTSLVGLADAIEAGDEVGAVVSGLNLVSYGATAYSNLINSGVAVGGPIGALNTSVVDGVPGATPLAMINIAYSLSKGDYLGAAIGVVSMIPVYGQIIAAVYTVVSIITSFWEDDPEPWASGRYKFNADGSLGFDVWGGDGGEPAVQGLMGNIKSALDQIVTQQQQAQPDRALGIIPSRLGAVDFRNDSFTITDTNPLTNQERGLTYSTDGKLLSGAPIGSDEFFQDMGTTYLISAILREAIAPMWEVQTARMQQTAGDPLAGMTEEQRAQRNRQLAPAPVAGATSLTWRPVVLDLAGNGIDIVKQANNSVGFNVNDQYTGGVMDAGRQAYLRQTDWIAAQDGFLMLDRNTNGVADSSKELFSNATVSNDARGLAGLKWVDADANNRIDAADPVFAQLKVWQDLNGNGNQDTGEAKSLSDLGITALNYGLGTYVKNGQTLQMASPDLQANLTGSAVSAAKNGILVQSAGVNGAIQHQQPSLPAYQTAWATRRFEARLGI